MFIINFCLNMFRASLCPSSGEQRPCVTPYGVLRWFCWMWLVAVVGRCVVGCEQCSDCCNLLVFSLFTHFMISYLRMCLDREIFLYLPRILNYYKGWYKIHSTLPTYCSTSSFQLLLHRQVQKTDDGPTQYSTKYSHRLKSQTERSVTQTISVMKRQLGQVRGSFVFAIRMPIKLYYFNFVFPCITV